MPRLRRTGAPAKALTHGLAILQHLVAAGRSQTSTEIAHALQMHQSSASRILRTLMAAGFVRKPDYHSFAADYGVLSLGAVSLRHFAIAREPRPVVEAIAERNPGVMVAVVKLWRGELLYFLRCGAGEDPAPVTFGYPLHLSSPALRLLLEHDADDAVAQLRASRERYGWDRPGPAVPADETAVLDHARRELRHDALLLADWQGPDRVSGAIRLDLPDEDDVALAIAGRRDGRSDEALALMLQDGRRRIEALMRGDRATAGAAN